ncbi:MAG: hypothetical protein ACLP2H_17590 [Terriglobales bacterium]
MAAADILKTSLGGSVPGFPFLASVIARMHFRMMDRPSYAIQTVAEHERNLAGKSAPSEAEAPLPTRSKAIG